MGEGGEGLAGTKREFGIVAGETTRVDIVRPVLTRLHGVVTGADGPVAGCTVALERGDGEGFPGLPGFGERNATTAADGTFSIADVESGSYTVRFGKQSQMVKSSARVVVPPDTPELRQDLALRTGKLRVHVCARDGGQPLEGAVVELDDKPESESAGGPGFRRVMMVSISDDNEGGGATSMTMGAPRALTGADGWAEVDDVPVGVYSVNVRHDQCAPAQKPGQAVAERQVTDCGKIELDRAGTIRGKVLAADGSPVPMALVQCRMADSHKWDPPEMAQGGAFRIKGRKTGRQFVRAMSLGGMRNDHGPEVEVTVAGGETVTAEVRLPAK
jgi:hypothetical protein